MIYRYQAYIARQLLSTLLMITVGLTCIIWLMQALRYLDFMVDQGISFAMFLQLTGMLLPSLVLTILPPSMLVATLFTYHKLKADSELTVLSAAGLSQWRLAWPSLCVAVVVMVIGYFIALVVQPASTTHFRDLQHYLRDHYASVLLQEGVFSNPTDGLTVFVRDRESDGTFKGILVHDARQKNTSVTMMAEEGHIVQTADGPRFNLVNGNRQEMRDGKLSFLTFATYALDMSVYNQTGNARQPEAAERSLFELFEPEEGLNDKEIGKRRSEAHQRLTWPGYALSVAALALAVLLSGEFNRRGQWKRIAVAAAIGTGLMFGAITLRGMAALHPEAVPLMYMLWLLPMGFCLWRLREAAR